MVEFLEVGEFVGNNVVDEVGGQEEEPQREVDIAQRGATAPAGGDVLNRESVELNVVGGSYGAQALCENHLCVIA